MAQVTKTQAIANFLKAKAHPELAELYNMHMECQVNVAKDGGTRIEGEYHGRYWQGWTDGIQTWKAFRIPHNANTEPEYKDIPMKFDLAQHVDGIGMTGWDWNQRASLWVAFDFDAIIGHSEKHVRKLTDEQILELQKTLTDIPWVTIRRSSAGKGLHVYVFLDPVETRNHTEHAALARAILGKISALARTDLETKVDICGQNMWIWHRKATSENQGLTLIKQGGRLKEIPTNWKDHVKVITGHRKKVLPKFLGDEDSPVERKFQSLTTQLSKVQLDAEHNRLINYLEKNASGSWWDADHHMLVTHTFWLKKAHQTLGLRGIFETLSAGTEAPNDVNAFLYPQRHGGWVARRYSLGVEEHDTWGQDSAGWTRCYYNTDPSVASASRMQLGIEDPTGGFVFNEAELAAEAVRLLGGKLDDLPVALKNKRAKIKEQKDGRIVLEIEGDAEGILRTDDKMKGWLFKSKKWMKLFNINTEQNVDLEGTVYDDLVRHLVTSVGDDAGWTLKGSEWRREPLVHITNALHTFGLKPPDIKTVIGSSVMKAWKIVNRPFQAEYPGDRIWNEKAAQLRFQPSQSERLIYPSWKKILSHVGSGLTNALQTNAWAKNNNILTGADYLKIWIASLFKEPLEPLPYLFLYGPQNSGKSILHEALAQLFTRGCVRADIALQNTQGFNEELANAVLCIVEEVDLRRDKVASNRIKDWVTAKDLSIHPKGRTPYQIQNATHWMQMANPSSACPVLPGDTRITSIFVDALDPIEMIPKKQLLIDLEREAPDFLAEVLSLEIPPSNDRLNVPVITTVEKLALQEFNQSPVEAFFSEICFPVDGAFENYGELYDKFIRFVDPTEAGVWSKKKFGREIPPQYPKARSRKTGEYVVGNISCTPPDPTAKKLPKYRLSEQDANGYVFLDFAEKEKEGEDSVNPKGTP